MLTRKQYLNGECTHSEYYEQFVTDSVIEIVRERIGEYLIRNSQDPHFNDIDLGKWDSSHERIAVIVSKKLREAGVVFIAQSDTVCIAKAAANMILQKGASR